MRGKMGKWNKRKLILCILAVLLIQGIGGMAVYAVLENTHSDAVRSVKMEDSQIEMSTLVVGSYLIHINGLTDELYAVAKESANEFNQSQVYYKSELAAGSWYEISEASSIADITTSEENLVDKSVIESLEFTHKTGADGITIDLRTGEAVSIFNIRDPYNLEGMQEVEPLLLQYQILQEKSKKTESDESYLKMISSFFEKDLQDDKTKECDTVLAALEEYKNGLASRDKPSMWLEKTESIMASVDADRRVIVLKKVARYLDILETQANGLGTEDSEDETEETSEGGDGTDTEAGTEADTEAGTEIEENPSLEVNSEIVAAIGDCIKNVQDSIVAYEAKRMTDLGETVSAKAEYQYSQQLIDRVKNNDTAGCDEAMEKICALQNILDGMISNQPAELDALTSELIDKAYQQYKEDLSAGICEEYVTAKAEGATQAVLAQYLTGQKTKANADRLEYQMMLDAAFQRMNNGAAQAYVLKLIDGVPAMKQSVQKDAAESYLKETVEEHLEWLRTSYATLVKNGSDSTQMEKLEQEKEKLGKQRRDALDNNDLAEANRLQAELEAVQKEIDSLMASLVAILNSPNSSEADKAKARAEMGDSNTASFLADMAGKLASAIRSFDADGDDLKNQLASLTAAAQLNPDAGQAALKQVGDALDQATGLNADLLDELGESLAKAEEEVNANAGGNLSQTALASLLDRVLERVSGTDFEHASFTQQASAILAMEWYGRKQNSDAALKLAASLARQAAEKNNPLVYEKYTSKDAYMSLQTLGTVLSYRYIFDDRHVTVTLQKGREYYLFTQSQVKYKVAGGNTKKLKTAPKLQNTLYIHGEDSEKIFGTKAEYIEKAQYGVAGTPSVETQAKEIYERLSGGGA